MKTISLLTEEDIRLIVGDAVRCVLNAEIVQPEKTKKANPFDDYIPKSEIRDKYASSSTLWQWEKAGKLKAYGIGGKRYYKREDIEKLFTPIK